MSDDDTITITVELSPEYVVAGEAGAPSAELRTLWAGEQVRLKR